MTYFLRFTETPQKDLERGTSIHSSDLSVNDFTAEQAAGHFGCDIDAVGEFNGCYGDFSVVASISGSNKIYRINDKMLSLFMFKHFNIEGKKSFKLTLSEVEEDSFKLTIK